MGIRHVRALAILLCALVGAGGCGAGSAEEVGSLRPIAAGVYAVPVEGRPVNVLVVVRHGKRGAE